MAFDPEKLARAERKAGVEDAQAPRLADIQQEQQRVGPGGGTDPATMRLRPGQVAPDILGAGREQQRQAFRMQGNRIPEELVDRTLGREIPRIAAGTLGEGAASILQGPGALTPRGRAVSAAVGGVTATAGEQFTRLALGEQFLSTEDFLQEAATTGAVDFTVGQTIKKTGDLFHAAVPTFAQSFQQVKNRFAELALESGFAKTVGDLSPVSNEQLIEMVKGMQRKMRVGKNIVGSAVSKAERLVLKERGDVPVRSAPLIKAVGRKAQDLAKRAQQGLSTGDFTPEDIAHLNNVASKMAKFDQFTYSEAKLILQELKGIADLPIAGAQSKAGKGLTNIARRAGKILSKQMNKADPRIGAARKAAAPMFEVWDEVADWMSKKPSEVVNAVFNGFKGDTAKMSMLLKADRVIAKGDSGLKELLLSMSKNEFARAFPKSVLLGPIGVASGIAGLGLSGTDRSAGDLAVTAAAFPAILAAISSPKILARGLIMAEKFGKAAPAIGRVAGQTGAAGVIKARKRKTLKDARKKKK